jgi:hypothetical protein
LAHALETNRVTINDYIPLHFTLFFLQILTKLTLKKNQIGDEGAKHFINTLADNMVRSSSASSF